jgi:hypothetical protein
MRLGGPIFTKADSAPGGYRRELDVMTGIATTRYTLAGTTFTRQLHYRLLRTIRGWGRPSSVSTSRPAILYSLFYAAPPLCSRR